MKRQGLAVLIVMVSIVALIGVAGAAEKTKYLGFLEDYSSLHPGPEEV